MLDVNKLATLRAVVENGSFSAAGHVIGLTQPAVSRQVALLEEQVGTQLVRRTQQGVHATEAGQVLVGHAEVVMGRLELAQAQLADLAGLRAGHVRLGSFLTALVHLSARLAVVLEHRHPDLFRHTRAVIEDQLVDRSTAFRRLAGGDLDVAMVFEHAFERDPAPPDVELFALFDDPACVLLPAEHPLAGARTVTTDDLADETWVRAHHGSAARLTDLVLGSRRSALIHAGHGDEPIEAQAFVAAGRGVMVAHRLNVIIAPEQIAVVGLHGGPVRHIQAAIMRGQRAPAALAAIEALQEVGRDWSRADRPD